MIGLSGVNYWKPHFSDLNQFDKVTLHELLYRIDSTLKEFKNYSGGTLIYHHEDYENIPEMKDLYDKFNKENSHTQVCFRYDGKPLFSKKYTSKKINSTSNWQTRDSSIKSPFEHLDLYKTHFQQIIDNKIKKHYLYISLPNSFINQYMEQTNNLWDMSIPRQFISEIKDWDDLDNLQEKVREYDKKYPNWNHDFPIMGFRSVLQKGLLFPNTTFKLDKILVTGTHRLFMCAMSGNDYPMFIPIPKGKKVFEVKSIRPIFKDKTFLKMIVDINQKKCTLFLNENEIGVV
jgi:hypothetical protein|tara:strand:- start:1684 stop:2550 length:867 start_codon:yes stop_codon:yes gene_type:complete